MNYLKVVLLIIAIMAIVATIYYSKARRPISPLTETTTLSSQGVLQPQTNSEGSVTVKITPIELLESAKTWDFEIVLDTHSGNLDQDLTKISVLIDDKGNQVSPISWEGDPPGGHHRQGVLRFNQITPRPRSIELRISQIGSIDERIFKWELK